VDDGFQFYKKGIFDRCIKDTANHAVVIVGFTTDYWIIRNSWGADWGEEGHIRVKRDQNNKNACSI
jgi:C1A family cysteine protease